MKTVLHYISLFLIVLALVLLGGDIMTSLEKDAFSVRSLAQVWTLIDKPSLDGFKAWLDHALPGSVAGAIEYSLNVWSWLPFGLIGVAMAFGLTRRGEYEG
ncbi:MAG TPA: hypothetical protein VGG48_12835 [Rhizomicrobium sp.]